MSAGTTYASGELALLLQNVANANIGTAAGLQPSASAGSLYISLHTANPGAGGNQSTSEASWAGYARVAIVRSASGWTVSGNSFQNAAAVTFPVATGGSETETYFAIGTAATGAGEIVLFGALQSSLAVSQNIQPTFPAGSLTGTLS